MTHATPKHPTEDSFTITVERPLGIDDERWEGLKQQIGDACAPVALELLGRCSTHPWCIAGGTPEHDDFHVSRTVDLLPPRAGEDLAAVSAWITQPRGEVSPMLVLDGHLPDRPQPLDLEIDARVAATLLTLAMERQAPLSAYAPGHALLDLLTEVAPLGTTTAGLDREAGR